MFDTSPFCRAAPEERERIAKESVAKGVELISAVQNLQMLLGLAANGVTGTLGAVAASASSPQQMLERVRAAQENIDALVQAVCLLCFFTAYLHDPETVLRNTTQQAVAEELSVLRAKIRKGKL